MRSSPSRFLGMLLMAVSLVVAAAAQAAPRGRWEALADIIFQNLEIADGLPNPVALAMAQDGTGFIWVGTSDGLGRWDGNRFRTYRPDPTRRGALPDNFIQALHTDASGRLWVGAATGGLASYDPQTDGFITYRIANGSGPSREGRVEILAIADDPVGGIWVGTADGLYHAGGPGEAPAVMTRDGGEGALPPGRVYSLLRDSSDRLWAGTTHGVFRRDRAGAPFRPVILPLAPSTQPTVPALMQDHAGRIWIATSGDGAFVVAADGAPVQVVEPPGAAGRVQSLIVESLAEVRPGEVWLGTAGDGIVTVDAETLHTGRIRHDPLRPTSLADDTVWALVKDRSGGLWAATNRGVGRYDPGQTGILTVFGGAGLRSTISDPDVMSIVGTPDGHVWVGMERHEVAVLDPAAAEPASLPQRVQLPNAIVTSLAQSPRAGVFIGTWRGLFRTDFGFDRLDQILLPGMPDKTAVTALTSDGDTLWIGTSDGPFRLALEPPGGGAGRAPATPPEAGPIGAVARVAIASQLTDMRVTVMLAAAGGKLWIGTRDGLNLYDPASGRVQRLRANPASPGGLQAGLIASLITDRHGRLWVATGGGGIDIVTGQPDDPAMRIQRIGTEDGLPNANVDKLLEAPDGQIWASTDDGIVRINPTTLKVSAFHLAQGVAISAYWINSGTVTREGELLFGGTGGFTVVRPDKLAETPNPLSIAITDLHIGGQRVPIGQWAGARQAAPLVVQPDANSLSLEFSALDFDDPRRDSYAYRLEGVDRSWIDIDPRRGQIAYTNLPPGPRTLLLRVSDPAGNQSADIMRVPILVLPAWYQTWWFDFACVVACFGAVLLTLRLQTVWLRTRQRGLERLIHQRTAELRESNKALSLSAGTLRELAEIGQEVTASHDADTILSVLHEHVCRLLDASHFAVYLVREPAQALTLCFGVRNGLRLAPDTPIEAQVADHLGRALRERQEVEIDLSAHPAGDSLRLGHRICAPLIVLDKAIGVMLIASRHATKMTDRDRMIVRTISAYGAIALDNAEILVALAQAQARLEHLAFSDGLTNLPNRRMYLEECERFRARSCAEQREFALLLIDLDRFKQINDTFGHDAGDAMLVETARRLQLAVRSGDLVMRLGGDEFAILLGSVEGLQSVARVCRRISDSFANPIHVSGSAIHASTSIGVAIYPEDGETVELLYKAADLALYEAKRAGRNTWRKFETTLAGTSDEAA